VGLDHSYLPITRFGIDQSDGVTAISHYLREQTVQQFKVKREIEVIPNFVNCDVYTPLTDETRAAGRAQYAEPGEKILIHLSNFRPVKRAVDAVEVFSRVAEQVPARLLMVGDGPDRSQAEWLARRKNIQERVHFLGKQASVNDLLPLADLMLMPSEMESFGLVALEAMACKVPTIATAVGGIPELIEDGLNGRLFPVGEVEAMAAAAIDLLGDNAKHAAMAEAGRKTAQQRFCASKIIPLYEGYYERVLERAGATV
jgi:N-acetyl-alpha-D-glucosaminyl L-malate synthase BshA